MYAVSFLYLLFKGVRCFREQEGGWRGMWRCVATRNLLSRLSWAGVQLLLLALKNGAERSLNLNLVLPRCERWRRRGRSKVQEEGGEDKKTVLLTWTRIQRKPKSVLQPSQRAKHRRSTELPRCDVVDGQLQCKLPEKEGEKRISS